MRWKILAVALVVAALTVPVASAAPAKHAPKRKLRLALVPPQEAPGGSLALQWFDSGTVSNNEAAFNAAGAVSPKQLKKLGRVTGYLLDYGNEFSGGPGVTEIKTGVDEYRTAKDAKKALPFWRKQDTLGVRSYKQLGVDTSSQSLKVRKLGSSHFASVTSMSIPNADPIYTVDEQVADSHFVLDSTVSAGTKTQAVQMAQNLAGQLVHRLRLGLAGKLTGTPATIPIFPEPGPPPGGPDLSTFLLGPSDLPPATLIGEGYTLDTVAISVYAITLRPAGAFGEVDEDVGWYANDNLATWEGTLSEDEIAELVSLGGQIGVTSVDVSSAGDHATAAILPISATFGGNGSTAIISLWSGQAVEEILAESDSSLKTSDVQSLADAAAARLNQGLAG